MHDVVGDDEIEADVSDVDDVDFFWMMKLKVMSM